MPSCAKRGSPNIAVFWSPMPIVTRCCCGWACASAGAAGGPARTKTTRARNRISARSAPCRLGQRLVAGGEADVTRELADLGAVLGHEGLGVLEATDVHGAQG